MKAACCQKKGRLVTWLYAFLGAPTLHPDICPTQTNVYPDGPRTTVYSDNWPPTNVGASHFSTPQVPLQDYAPLLQYQ